MADPDSLPTSTDPSGPCPRCGRISNFALQGQLAVVGGPPPAVQESVVVLRCMGCDGGTVVIERVQPEGRAPLHWWPTDDSGHLDPVVPQGVSSWYDEGRHCLSVHADRAAAMMFRAALAEIVARLGSTSAQSRSTLFDQLAKMEADGVLHPDLLEWARDLRLLGSVGPHPNSLAEVGAGEAAELGRLARQLIEVLFEVPARITRARSSPGASVP